VEVLTRYLAKELGPRHIAVNKVVTAMTALGRAGLADDIGEAITALLSGNTGGKTGQRIEVSCGQNF
jgi:enoyl-[acyl-carrier-protein] reductase (NADH)